MALAEVCGYQDPSFQRGFGALNSSSVHGSLVDDALLGSQNFMIPYSLTVIIYMYIFFCFVLCSHFFAMSSTSDQS